MLHKVYNLINLKNLTLKVEILHITLKIWYNLVHLQLYWKILHINLETKKNFFTKKSSVLDLYLKHIKTLSPKSLTNLLVDNITK